MSSTSSSWLQSDRLLLLNRRAIANGTPQLVMSLAIMQQTYGENIRLLHFTNIDTVKPRVSMQPTSLKPSRLWNP